MRLPGILTAPRESPNRYLHLLLWMAASILAEAIRLQFGGSMHLIDAVFAGVLLATLRALSRHRAEFVFAAFTGAGALGASVASGVHAAAALQATANIFAAAFTGFLSAVILREVLQAGRIDADKICGAICAYIFIGLFWARLYMLVDLLIPGSFQPSGADPGSGGEFVARLGSMHYFSFVTLATLGYGDIVPGQPVARTLAWMEAVFGQFYIAVLVARLVGLVQGRPRSG